MLDLDVAMPDATKRADMRLVNIKQFLTWTGLRMYEELHPGDFESIPYSDTTDAMWAQTLLLSWRWSKEKPAQYVRGFSPMSQHQLAWLQAYVELQLEQNAASLQFVWIDWCCVPQYSSSPMLEVGRSKVRSRGAENGLCV